MILGRESSAIVRTDHNLFRSEGRIFLGLIQLWVSMFIYDSPHLVERQSESPEFHAHRSCTWDRGFQTFARKKKKKCKGHKITTTRWERWSRGDVARSWSGTSWQTGNKRLPECRWAHRQLRVYPPRYRGAHRTGSLRSSWQSLAAIPHWHSERRNFVVKIRG